MSPLVSQGVVVKTIGGRRKLRPNLACDSDSRFYGPCRNTFFAGRRSMALVLSNLSAHTSWKWPRSYVLLPERISRNFSGTLHLRPITYSNDILLYNSSSQTRHPNHKYPSLQPPLAEIINPTAPNDSTYPRPPLGLACRPSLHVRRRTCSRHSLRRPKA